MLLRVCNPKPCLQYTRSLVFDVIDFICDLKLVKAINGNYSDVADGLITIPRSINYVLTQVPFGQIYKNLLKHLLALKILIQIPTLRIRFCHNAWEVSKYGVFLVRISPYSDWIRRFTEYLRRFSHSAKSF